MASTKKPGFKKRGLALIMVNKDFSDKRLVRKGATRDLDMMVKLFEMLDFKVKRYLNLTADEMLNILDKAKKWEYDYAPECFVCVVSSHGGEAEDTGKGKKRKSVTLWRPTVLGADEIPVNVEDIINKVSDNNCEAYRGKPKLFFIQACRERWKPIDQVQVTEKYDPGLEILMQQLTMKDGRRRGGGDSRDSVTGNQAEIGGTTPLEAGDQMGVEDDDIQTLKKLLEGEELSDDEWDGEVSDNDEDDESLGEETDAQGKAAGDTPDPKHRPDPAGSPSDMIPVPNAQGAAAGDTPDPKHRPDPAVSPSDMIPVPNEIAAVEIPQNCLLMVPVMSGKFAFRNSWSGSYMLRFMYDNIGLLMNGEPVLQYLSQVCGQISQYEYNPNPIPKCLHPDVVKMLPCKMCACTMHRLTDLITFEPTENDSVMANLKRLREKRTMPLELIEMKD